MPVISFASAKGGTGKTTSAIILATTLASRYRVTLIDADPAKNILSWARKGDLPQRLAMINSKGVDHIHDEIDQGRENSQFVIIDTEGSTSRLNGFVMGESDLVIIPMGDEQFDAEKAIETLAQLSLQSRAVRREIPARVLFTRTQAAVKSRLEKSLNAQVRDKVGSFETELHRRTAFASLPAFGGSLYSLDREETSGVAKAIANAELFTEELLTTMGWLSQAKLKSHLNAAKEELCHEQDAHTVIYPTH